ncbi:MAG TPA: type VI secretion protein IcmF/TssM N-terminal domain-containing protein, partial [Anaeromyxobacteraceae bacterium]|nr:type VI secretion protein IcmF/TssM N-terminal domain-containing protein [Anaeromyxobacteraceae bacterium]
MIRTPRSKRGDVRGVGGTRNCEWWLTNEAVLLDIAGRYSIGDEDHDEWISFLDMLARTRSHKPINGLVAVPITDLAGESGDGSAEMGSLMRERVDEVLVRLVFPIYVLLTKGGLLPGFVESFADLRKAERGQVWGFSLSLDEAVYHCSELLRDWFDELVSVAEERALRRLADERQLEARERAYEFPQQLEAVRRSLFALLDALFAEDVYRDAPILGGVYLTSGTQKGRVIDRIMSAMAEAFGVRRAVSATAEPVLEAKSYFLSDEPVHSPGVARAAGRGSLGRAVRDGRRPHRCQPRGEERRLPC